MVVSNLKVVSRKIKGFTANSERGQDSVNINGTYVIEIQNNGILPTASLSFTLDKFTYGSGNDIILSKYKGLGRIQPADKKKVEFEISEEIDDTPENLGTVQRSCNNKMIVCVSEETITGTLFAKSFSMSGGIVVSSTSCSVVQLQENNDQNENGTEDEPPGDGDGTQEPPENDDVLPAEPQNGEILVSLPEMPPGRENPRMGIEAFNTITESGQEISQEIVAENTGTRRVAPRFAHVILDRNEVVDTCGEGVYEIGPGEVGTITLSGTVDVEPDDYDIGITVNGDIELRKSETNTDSGGDNEDNTGDEEQNGEGENGGEQNGENNQESEILGPNILSVGEEGLYRWTDFPPETVSFRWQVLAEGEEDDEPTTLGLVEATTTGLVLNFVSEAQGDFLIRIIATAGGQRLEQVQKVVSVIPAPAENP